MNKRLFVVQVLKSGLLLLCMVVITLSTFAQEPDFKVDGFYYKVENYEKHTCIVWGPGYTDYVGLGKVKYPSSDIRIPSKVTYNGVTFTVVGINGSNGDSYEPFTCNENITSLYVPGTVKWIGGGAFEDCTSLTSITIPNSVTSIGASTFWGCHGLTSITIPNSVTSIGYGAFCGCHGLTSITIPDRVYSIGNSAFCNCTGLKSMTCYASTPPACGSNPFYNVSASIPLYVPAASIKKYKTATGWEQFTNIKAIN